MLLRLNRRAGAGKTPSMLEEREGTDDKACGSAGPPPGVATGPFLRLDDFLKLTGRARSGGEAKHRIQAGEVQVNGAVETHRSRKLRQGDAVTMDGETMKVEVEEHGGR
jgi:ribosome-associated protein